MNFQLFEKLLLPATIVLALALGGAIAFATSILGTSSMGSTGGVASTSTGGGL